MVAVGAAALVLVAPVLLLLRDHPGELGIRAYGAADFEPPPPRTSGAGRRAVAVLGEAVRSRSFWLLAATFGVCGASTNGIMMTHFVPASGEHGMSATTASSVLAVMGVCNVVGAAGSGWLTDRFGERGLLAAYYALRGLSLLVLPLIMGSTVGKPMLVFAVGYGLLDLATVPPTIALCRALHGPDDGAIVFGWISATHAVGAGVAAFLGGVARGLTGSYTAVWVGSGVLCLVATALALGIRKPLPRREVLGRSAR